MDEEPGGPVQRAVTQLSMFPDVVKEWTRKMLVPEDWMDEET